MYKLIVRIKGFELDADYVKISNEKLNYVEPNYKLGEHYVSFYLNEVVTIRNKDWENISENFIIPEPMRAIDYAKIKLKSKTLVPQEKEVIYQFEECKIENNGIEREELGTLIASSLFKNSKKHQVSTTLFALFEQ